jgi:hypothetical protein
MRFLSVLGLLALSACMPGSGADVSMRGGGQTVSTKSDPAFAAPVVATSRRAQRSNGEIASDFMALEFQLESGRALPVFTRFETPISISLTGAVPATAPGDLAHLIGRFRSEAGLDVRAASGQANITVEFVPRRTLQTAYSNVACFVVPNVSSWDEFRAAKGTAALDWTRVTKRDRVAIFAPADSSPQEVRDCLHEEIAQAMGPLNDLYHLPDSVFNDDNFNTSLTGFDMLVLRLHYAPELRSGMSREQVARQIPGLLARLNPAGQRAGGPAATRTPRAWVDAMNTALGPQGNPASRRRAADMALSIAQSQGWQDGRLAFAHFAVGRVNLGHDPQRSADGFAAALRLYRTLPGGQIHAAHVEMQMAAFALTQGDGQTALALAERAIPVVRGAENAALLATLSFVKAEALEMLGRDAEARALRLDSQAVARYGFGSDALMRDRMRDIASLARRGGRG